MNNARRKRIRDAAEQMEQLKGEIESILEDEEEYMDNIPENMQGSERYETAETACENLQSAVDAMEEVLSSLEEAQN